MINAFNAWAKNIGTVVIVVSIIEMLIMNSKNKKYIRVILGLFIVFNILQPFASKTRAFEESGSKLYESITNEITNTKETYRYENIENNEINSESMDERIKSLYKEQLKKDIKEKLENKNINVNYIKIELLDEKNRNGENYKIKEIILKLRKKEEKKEENKKESTQNLKEVEEAEGLKVETEEIKEIKKVEEIQIGNNTTKENEKNKITNMLNINKEEIKEIETFLEKEYGVRKECLKINLK